MRPMHPHKGELRAMVRSKIGSLQEADRGTRSFSRTFKVLLFHPNLSKKEVVTENRAHLNPAGSEAGAKPDYSIKTMASSEGKPPIARSMVGLNGPFKGDATKLEIANDRHPRPAVMRVSFFVCASLEPRQPRPLPGALFLVGPFPSALYFRPFQSDRFEFSFGDFQNFSRQDLKKRIFRRPFRLSAL